MSERLTQLWYEAENSGTITMLLRGGAVMVGQLQLTGVNTRGNHKTTGLVPLIQYSDTTITSAKY